MNSKSLVAVGAGLILLGSVAAASAKSNQEFLTDAIQGNLVEISMGQLAQKNGGSDGVRSFGQMLVQDHSAANEKGDISRPDARRDSADGTEAGGETGVRSAVEA